MKFIREVCVAGAVVDVSLKSTQKQLSVRAPKTKPSREAVIKNNDRIAYKRLARTLNANFYPGDWHITLTYSGVMNYIDIQIITKQWEKGRVRCTALDDSRNYQKLASYLIKETQKTFRKADNMTKRRYRASRNLVHPIVVTQEVKLSKVLWEEPKAFKGYAIDEDSIRRFENPCTHIPHLEYMMVSTDPVPRLKKWRNGTAVKKQETYMRAEELKQMEMSDYESWGTL